MRHLPVQNPQSRFVTTSLEYEEGEAPNAELEVYEDQTRNILATNDSPDVGFRWSVNPYRGCIHACAYCLDGETLVLMGDGGTRKLRDLRVGDAIYGTSERGKRRRYARTTVLAHWETKKRAYRIHLEDGTTLVASADHRFLTLRGWKHVAPAERGAPPRAHLVAGTKLMGIGAVTPTPSVTQDYMRGYLSGLCRADGLLSPPATKDAPSEFRLALVDLEALRRARHYLESARIACGPTYVFQQTPPVIRPQMAFRTLDGGQESAIKRILEWPSEPSREWARGFLGGIFDAQGSTSQGVLRISSTDTTTLEEVGRCLRMFGFDGVLDTSLKTRSSANVRVRGDLRDRLRFLHLTDPAIRRKWELEGATIQSRADLHVKAVEDTREAVPMFDITTGTGDFIANGIVSHNCYARPSHEYLSFGAGTDFERKIVVKPRAPELLREAFEKKSWKGELVVFSGITDCYQPLEREMRLTRGCMEVCAEYKNPVGVITKSPVIERDVDVLQQLSRDASARVSVSIPFWDPVVARAMEPMVTVPERRMKIIETLTKAGIRVGVSMAPIVPGLNDDHLGELLERARDAGASYAFFVLLRLPGPVKEVFEASLREKLPLRAEKVLRRMREAHGGKLYDSRFGMRQHGDSVYTEAIRALFEQTTKRLGLVSDPMVNYASVATFQRPDRSKQMSFGF